MASVPYTIVYDASSAAKAAQDIDRLAAALTRLDAIADRVKPKIKGLGTGSTRGLNSLQKAADALNVSLGTLQVKATAAGTAVKGAGAAAAGAAPSIRKAGSEGQKAGLSVGRLAEAALLLRGATAVVHAMADAMNDARKYAEETADKVLKLNDKVRELRATVGNGMTTKQATKQIADLMFKTGANSDEANAFDTMWESTVPAAVKKGQWGLDASQTKDAKERLLAFAVANGMDPKVMGEMAPAVGIAEPLKSADDLVGKVGTMTRLGIEGVGKTSEIMTVYKKLKGTMVRPEGGGAFRSSEELLASISTNTADTTPGASKTMAEQVWRDLVFADNDTKKATFEKYGLKPGDDYETRLKKIAPLVEGAAAEGKDPLQALKEAGFGRTGSNPKIIMAVKSRRLLAENLKIARGGGGAAGVDEFNARFKSEQPDRFAAAADAVADLNQGERMVDLVTMRKYASAGLKNRGAINGEGSNLEENIADLGGLVPFLSGGQTARDKRLDDVVRKQIIDNVPDAKQRFPGMFDQAAWFSPKANRGETLSGVLKQLSPEERDLVNRSMEVYSRTRGDSSLVPRRRPAGAPAGGAPGAAGAAPGGVGPQASLDPALTDLNRRQLGVLERIDRKLSPGGGPGGGFSPRPGLDGGDYSPERIG